MNPDEQNKIIHFFPLFSSLTIFYPLSCLPSIQNTVLAVRCSKKSFKSAAPDLLYFFSFLLILLSNNLPPVAAVTRNLLPVLAIGSTEQCLSEYQTLKVSNRVCRYPSSVLQGGLLEVCPVASAPYITPCRMRPSFIRRISKSSLAG